jgi:hypothetical protein
LFAPAPGSTAGQAPTQVQQPRHLTDQFGPSRFPTLQDKKEKEKDKDKRN